MTKKVIKSVDGKVLLTVDCEDPSDLSDMSFFGVDLAGADFRGVVLRSVNFGGANLVRANFEGARLYLANFQSADLRGANLKDTCLMHAFAAGVNFQGADLTNADLRDTYLRRADFRGANLTNADFRGSDCFLAKGDFFRVNGMRGAVVAVDENNVSIGYYRCSLSTWLNNSSEYLKKTDFSEVEIAEYAKYLEYVVEYFARRSARLDK